MSTTRTNFEMGLREYARTPVLLVLLLFLPAYFIGVFSAVVPDDPVPVIIPGEGVLQIPMTSLTSVLMTPLATALVGGIAGLFLMQSARDVDGRLAVVGTSVPEILLARGAVLALASVVATLVSVAVLAVTYVPERPGWFLIGVAITALLYGGVGALFGLVLNRLAGVYLLMFGPLLDIFLAQSPFAEESVAVAEYLPAHYPMQLVFDAAFTSAVDRWNLLPALAYLIAVFVLVGLAFVRQLRVD